VNNPGTSSPATSSYVYDAAGSLLLQKDAATGSQDPATTLYLPGEQLTLDTKTGTITGDRFLALPGGGEVVCTGADTTSGTPGYYYQLTDQHGTATLAIGPALTAAQATWRELTPYGAPRGPAVTWMDNRGFLDKPQDATTGLTSIGARWYDPATGTFQSLDPVFEGGSPQQQNGYTYAGGNPVSSSDPTGLRQKCDNGPCPPPPPPSTQKNENPLPTGGGGGGGQGPSSSNNDMGRAVRSAPTLQTHCDVDFQCSKFAYQINNWNAWQSWRSSCGPVKYIDAICDAVPPFTIIDLLMHHSPPNPFGLYYFPRPPKPVAPPPVITRSVPLPPPSPAPNPDAGWDHFWATYGYWSGSFCGIACSSVTYQHGRLQFSEGGVGFGAWGGAAGANSYTPQEVGNWTYGGCGIWAVGLCVNDAQSSDGDNHLGGGLNFGGGWFLGESYTYFSLGRGGISLFGWHWNTA